MTLRINLMVEVVLVVMIKTAMIRWRRWMEGPQENEIVRLGERMRIQWSGTKQVRMETKYVEPKITINGIKVFPAC